MSGPGGVRAALRQVAELQRVQLQGFLAAMLPTPDREKYARPRGLDAPRWSLEVGVVEMLGGGLTFLLGGLRYMRPATGDQSVVLLENPFPGLSTTHFQGLGLLNALAWLLNPASWLLAYFALVGITRCLAFAVTREAVGEPVVWAGLRAWQASRRALLRRIDESRLGPPRPDRVVAGGEREVLVVACRAKTDWSPEATIAIGDRFYRLAGVERLADGPWEAFRYRLREAEPGEVIRRLVRYDPNAGAGRDRSAL